MRSFLLLTTLILTACAAQAEDYKTFPKALEFKAVSSREARNMLKGVDIPDKIDPRNPGMMDMSKPPSEYLFLNILLPNTI